MKISLDTREFILNLESEIEYLEDEDKIKLVKLLALDNPQGLHDGIASCGEFTTIFHNIQHPTFQRLMYTMVCDYFLECDYVKQVFDDRDFKAAGL